MKIKVANAEGVVLDWLVAKCEGVDHLFAAHDVGRYHFSTDWSQGGPIIDRLMDTCHFFILENDKGHGHHCALSITPHDNHHGTGKTPLIAAMRCYCCAELGEEVEVPDEPHNA